MLFCATDADVGWKNGMGGGGGGYSLGWLQPNALLISASDFCAADGAFPAVDWEGNGVGV